MRRWLVTLVLLGCGSTSPVTSAPEAGAPDAARADPGSADASADADAPEASAEAGTATDPAAPLFDPNHVVEVSITLPAADWDTLRNQTRTLGAIIEGSCLAQPIQSPFTTFEASITVDGKSLPRVGLHKKGFIGSLDRAKPSLKVELDEYVAGQQHLGLRKLTLNNAHQDASLVRQCLTYPVFSAAGVAAPRCNFAHVRVNGADLGVYVHVESMDKIMMAKRFGDGSGSLYEGTLSDFRPLWVNTFDAKAKSGDRSDLLPIVEALKTASDANLLAALEPQLDVDKFLTYWATENITNHWDGYANNKNNFYVYREPTSKKLVFLPWGVDATMMPGATFGRLGSTDGPIAVAASGALANRLFGLPATRKALLDRQRALLASAWKEPLLLAEVDRMERLLGPIADSVTGTAWHAGVAQVRTFINERRAKLTAAMDAGPTWTDPLAGYPCVDVTARVEGTFSTTYGTLGSATPLSTGSGTLAITSGGVRTVLTPVGALAGVEPTAPTRTTLQALGLRASDGHVLIASVTMPSSRVTPRVLNVDVFEARGVVVDYDPVTKVSTQLGAMFGELTLSQAATTNGARIAGVFAANVDVAGTPPP